MEQVVETSQHGQEETGLGELRVSANPGSWQAIVKASSNPVSPAEALFKRFAISVVPSKLARIMQPEDQKIKFNRAGSRTT
jgi:hypothetical protein